MPRGPSDASSNLRCCISPRGDRCPKSRAAQQSLPGDPRDSRLRRSRSYGRAVPSPNKIELGLARRLQRLNSEQAVNSNGMTGINLFMILTSSRDSKITLFELPGPKPLRLGDGPDHGSNVYFGVRLLCEGTPQAGRFCQGYDVCLSGQSCIWMRNHPDFACPWIEGAASPKTEAGRAGCVPCFSPSPANQAERSSRNLRDCAFLRVATASASTLSADTVVSQSMQPSVMLCP
jgi:hypothetical protein